MSAQQNAQYNQNIQTKVSLLMIGRASCRERVSSPV